MLWPWFFEVEIIDVNHKVLGTWSQYVTVTMRFEIREVRCSVGDRSIKFNFVSSYCESHYASLFIMGPNFAENIDICNLGAWGN